MKTELILNQKLRESFLTKLKLAFPKNRINEEQNLVLIKLSTNNVEKIKEYKTLSKTQVHLFKKVFVNLIHERVDPFFFHTIIKKQKGDFVVHEMHFTRKQNTGMKEYSYKVEKSKVSFYKQTGYISVLCIR